MNKEVLIALGALIGAAVSLLQVVMKFIGERRQDAIAARRLGTALQKIEVLERWYGVKSQVADADTRDQIRSDVNAKLDQIIIDAEQSQPRDPLSRPVPPLQRGLLLFFPRSAIGWLSRITLIFCVTFGILVAFFPVQPPPDEKPSDPAALMVGLFMCFGFPCLLLYAVSIWDGGRYHNPEQEDRSTA